MADRAACVEGVAAMQRCVNGGSNNQPAREQRLQVSILADEHVTCRHSDGHADRGCENP
jgi:hypothetical protein